MTWAAPHMLYGLAVPAIGLLVALLLSRRAKQNSRLPKAQRIRAGAKGAQMEKRARKQPLKWLFYLGLALLVFALARPQWGTVEREVFQRSREVIVAIDLSKSMLAEDIKPSRLERAKITVESLLDQLQGESVGLIVFAGTAFLQSPMSPDYQILRGFLEELSPDFLPQGGTDYEAMLESALDSFKQSDSLADRFLVVISDGESQSENWTSRIDDLTEQNVKVIGLGFGTEQGGFIPDGAGGYHKDTQGAVVLTKLEPASLQALARSTNGLYRDANQWVDLAGLIEETIRRGKAAKTGSLSQSFQIERFQLFLGPALLLLILSLFREFPSYPKARKIEPTLASQ